MDPVAQVFIADGHTWSLDHAQIRALEGNGPIVGIPGAERLLVHGGRAFAWGASARIDAVSLTTGPRWQLAGHPATVRGVLMGANGEVLSWSPRDARLWRLDRPHGVVRTRTGIKFATGLALSPDGLDAVVIPGPALLDFEGHTLSMSSRTPPEDVVDGWGFVASMSREGFTSIMLDLHTVAFSPGGSRLALLGQSSAAVFDRAREQGLDVQLPPGRPVGVGWSADTVLCVVSEDGQVWSWTGSDATTLRGQLPGPAIRAWADGPKVWATLADRGFGQWTADEGWRLLDEFSVEIAAYNPAGVAWIGEGGEARGLAEGLGRVDLLAYGAGGWVSSVGYKLFWTDGSSRLELARDAPLRAIAGSPRHIAALTDTGELTVWEPSWRAAVESLR